MSVADFLARQGRWIFALAIVCLGVEHFFFAHYSEPAVPILPWVPAHPWLAYLTGGFLVAAGLSILSGKKARLFAILLGTLFFVCSLLLQVPRAVAHPLDIGIRTLVFELLAMSASAFMFARTLPADGSVSTERGGVLDKVLRSETYLFAVSSVVFGVDHFLILGFIASLIPTWIPGHMFWACLTGAAFIAAGVSIVTKWFAPWGAIFLGIMFGLWFLLLHSLRILGVIPIAGAFHNPNEWSSALIALGLCGGSWICAWEYLVDKPRKPAHASN